MPLAFSLEALRAAHGCSVYVETGLWDCAYNVSVKNALRADFAKVVSIELHAKWVEKARRLLSPFMDRGRLEVIQGDSATVDLAALVPADARAVFFLDAHLDANIPEAEAATRPCPLLEELASIKTHARNDHVILVDDVRLLKQPRPWGDSMTNALDAITEAIREINPAYVISFLDGYVKGDVLCATITSASIASIATTTSTASEAKPTPDASTADAPTT